MLRENAVKKKIAAGETCIAAMLSLSSLPVAELLAANADAVIFEAEHSTLSEAEVEALARAVEVAGGVPLCRTPSASPEFIQRVLDAGVTSIIVPHMDSAESVRRVVEAAKYPPVGRRGAGGMTRATGYGAFGRDTYFDRANAETLIIPMIEDPEAVGRIDEIIAVPGVDMIFLGRNDLSLTMGLAPSHPTYIAAVDRVVAAAVAAKMPYMVAADGADAVAWIERGASMISVQVMQFIRREWIAGVGKLRQVKKRT